MAIKRVYKGKLEPDAGASREEYVVTTDDRTTIRRANDFRTVYDLVYYVLGLVELLLAFRFFLILLGANARNQFVSFIYWLTDPMVNPFRGSFTRANANGATVDTTTILAMIVYAALVWAVGKVIDIIYKNQTRESKEL